jgi:hypothetical protein
LVRCSSSTYWSGNCIKEVSAPYASPICAIACPSPGKPPGNLHVVGVRISIHHLLHVDQLYQQTFAILLGSKETTQLMLLEAFDRALEAHEKGFAA